jgi:hypothetical protein
MNVAVECLPFLCIREAWGSSLVLQIELTQDLLEFS